MGLLVGKHGLGGWSGPKSPNGTAGHNPAVDCGVPPQGEGCLFDLSLDPSEHVNLAGIAKHNDKRDYLLSRIQLHNSTTHSPNRGAQDDRACAIGARKYG